MEEYMRIGKTRKLEATSAQDRDQSSSPACHTVWRKHDKDIWDAMSKRVQCSVCHVGLPNTHLLDLHMSEAHDYFFQAQAARGYPVYRCLVEECIGAFSTASKRKEHLEKEHRFFPDYSFDTMHLRKKEKTTKSKKKHRDNSSQDAMGDAMDICQDGLSRLQIGSTKVPLNVSFGRRKGPSLAQTK